MRKNLAESAAEIEQGYARTLNKLALNIDELSAMNTKMDSLLAKLRAGEFDQQGDPEAASDMARLRGKVDQMSAKLAATLKAAEDHASETKSNAFQALVLGGLIFKMLFGRKRSMDRKRDG